MLIEPFEPPYDEVYDTLEVWKVTILWDGDEYETRYIPDIGYDSCELLDGFKREFYADVIRSLGYLSKWTDFVYILNPKVFTKVDRLDSAELLASIPSYPWLESSRARMYTKKNVVDWLKDNSERWLKIEVMDFWQIPEREQDKVRDFVEEERALQNYYNNGGE